MNLASNRPIIYHPKFLVDYTEKQRTSLASRSCPLNLQMRLMNGFQISAFHSRKALESHQANITSKNTPITVLAANLLTSLFAI